MDLLRKYKLKKGFRPGELIERSRIKRVAVNKMGKGTKKSNTLAQTDGKIVNGKFTPKKVTIYKKAHGKNKKKSENRIIDTIVHEENHIKHPNATEKEVYKMSGAKKIKKMSKKAKNKLYSKYCSKKRKGKFMAKGDLVKEHKSLVKTLKNPTKKNLAKEAKEQGKELNEYKKLKCK